MTPSSIFAFRRSRRARSGRIWLVLLVMLAVLGASGYGWWRYQSSNASKMLDAPVTQVISRGPFDHIVLEQGEIESSSNVEVKCEVKGKGTSGTPILWVIDEGTYVKKGADLVKLDSSALEAELQTQRITLSAADAAVISSDAAVKQALIAREEYLKGTYLTERKAILSEIAVAQQGLRKAELSLASAERLAAKGSLKSLQIEAEQFAVQNARNVLDAAEGRLKVLDELTKEKMLVQFDSDIETKRAKLESDKKTASEEKRKLDEIEEQISACLIHSPAEGQVVYANKFSSRGGSEFLVEPGAMVREQQTIIVLPDPSQMQVKAKINESRITLVREGMPARIRVNAVQGDLLGQVTKVNKYAEPGSWYSSSVKEYATFIQILDPPEAIRTGMTAEVRIFVEQLEDAVQAPILTVYEMKGHHFMLVKNGDKWETKEVTIGATNDKYVTLLDGVTEGMEVALNPREHLDLMEIPEIKEEDDRGKLAEIAKTPVAKQPGAGRGNAGGPEAMVAAAMQRVDTNGDGKISKEEAASNEMMAKSFDSTDTNKDGMVDRAEFTAAMKKRSAEGGGARGPGGEEGPGRGRGPVGQGGTGGSGGTGGR